MPLEALPPDQYYTTRALIEVTRILSSSELHVDLVSTGFDFGGHCLNWLWAALYHNLSNSVLGFSHRITRAQRVSYLAYLPDLLIHVFCFPHMVILIQSVTRVAERPSTWLTSSLGRNLLSLSDSRPQHV